MLRLLAAFWKQWPRCSHLDGIQSVKITSQKIPIVKAFKVSSIDGAKLIIKRTTPGINTFYSFPLLQKLPCCLFKSILFDVFFQTGCTGMIGDGLQVKNTCSLSSDSA